MEDFLYLRPEGFAEDNTSALRTYEDCRDECLTENDCSGFYFIYQTCYKNTFKEFNLTRYQPGVYVVKVFRQPQSCNLTFGDLITDPTYSSMDVPTNPGQKYSYMIYDKYVRFHVV
uniref:Apple domain-containing protein n=1 Tax=Caenorhabditis japonica TaxID=281687 RepID=A0A8R1ED14_CAEJA